MDESADEVSESSGGEVVVRGPITPDRALAIATGSELGTARLGAVLAPGRVFAGLPAWRYPAELPQGRKAARVGRLCRVRGEFFVPGPGFPSGRESVLRRG